MTAAGIALIAGGLVALGLLRWLLVSGAGARRNTRIGRGRRTGIGRRSGAYGLTGRARRTGADPVEGEHTTGWHAGTYPEESGDLAVAGPTSPAPFRAGGGAPYQHDWSAVEAPALGYGSDDGCPAPPAPEEADPFAPRWDGDPRYRPHAETLAAAPSHAPWDGWDDAAATAVLSRISDDGYPSAPVSPVPAAMPDPPASTLDAEPAWPPLHPDPTPPPFPPQASHGPAAEPAPAGHEHDDAGGPAAEAAGYLDEPAPPVVPQPEAVAARPEPLTAEPGAATAQPEPADPAGPQTGGFVVVTAAGAAGDGDGDGPFVVRRRRLAALRRQRPDGGIDGGRITHPRAEARRRLTAATEVIPAVSDLTALLPAVREPVEHATFGAQQHRGADGALDNRPRPRPRPRPSPQPREQRSTVYVSRHAADPH